MEYGANGPGRVSSPADRRRPASYSCRRLELSHSHRSARGGLKRATCCCHCGGHAIGAAGGMPIGGLEVTKADGWCFLAGCFSGRKGLHDLRILWRMSKKKQRTGGRYRGRNVNGRNNNNRVGGGGGGGRGGPNRRRSYGQDQGRREYEPQDNGEPLPLITGSGVLEMHPNGYGFLRNPATNFTRERTDPFVPGTMIEKFGLREGVLISGMVQHHRKRTRAAAAEKSSMSMAWLPTTTSTSRLSTS